MQEELNNEGCAPFVLKKHKNFLYHHGKHVTCCSVKKTAFDQVENDDMKFRVSPQSMEKNSCQFWFTFFPI